MYNTLASICIKRSLLYVLHMFAYLQIAMPFLSALYRFVFKLAFSLQEKNIASVRAGGSCPRAWITHSHLLNSFVLGHPFVALHDVQTVVRPKTNPKINEFPLGHAETIHDCDVAIFPSCFGNTHFVCPFNQLAGRAHKCTKHAINRMPDASTTHTTLYAQGVHLRKSRSPPLDSFAGGACS
jgi:hypothetical protein